jgi:cytochrome c oxidase assembly protein subunit 15
VTPSATAATYDRRYHLFCRTLAGLVFLLIVAGALVTSNDAGLAVPDWPTSFGSLYKIPPMVGGIKFEHGHRMLAELVGLFTIVLCVWSIRREKRRFMRGLGIAALGTVILQGVLGGLTVLLFLPWYVSSAHAALGQTYFSLVVLMALFSSRSWIESQPQGLTDSGSPGTHSLTLLTLGAIYLQLFFGAAFRHHGMSIMEHLLNAVLVSGVVIATAIRVIGKYNDVPAIRIPGKALMHLLFLQLFLGAAAFMTRVVWGKDAPQPLPSMVWSTIAHVATGALMLAMAFVLEQQVRRHVGHAPVAEAIGEPGSGKVATA